MSQTCADPSFGLKAPALAVLQLLAAEEPTFATWNDEHEHYEVNIKTFPWYNGRERGICLVVFRGYGSESGGCLCVVVTECRNSDDIVIQTWQQRHLFNQPTVLTQDQATEEDNTEVSIWAFSPQQFHLVTPKVIELMGEWYNR